MFKNIAILSDEQLRKKKMIREKIPKLNLGQASKAGNKIIEVKKFILLIK